MVIRVSWRPMPPVLAWLGTLFGLLFATLPGLVPGDATHPAPGLTDAPNVRASGPVSPAAAPCTADSISQSTKYPRSILASVVSRGGSTWAIGLTTLSEDPRYPLATRWDGTSWTSMPITPSSAERALFGLDRSPSGRMWAAGYRARHSLYYPMMMRWSGKEWIVSHLDAIGKRGGALLSVRAQSNANTWAVGYKIGTAGQRPMAIRRVGQEWKDASPRIPAGATGVLMDVDARSGDDVWAVGWTTHRGAPRAYVSHWDGRRWTASTARPSRSEGALTSVAIGGRDDVWAVGYRVVGGLYQPLVEHWNGKHWRVVPFADVGSPVSLLRAVQLDGQDRPVVVGTRWDAPSGEWQGLTARRQDGAWQVVDAPPLTGGTELRDLALRQDGSAVVVGANAARSLAMRLCPGAPGTGGPLPGTPSPSPGPATTPPAPSSAAPSPAASALPGGSPGVGPVSSSAPGLTPRPTATRVPGTARRAGPRTAIPVIARDVTVEAGLARDTTSYGAVRADFDGDGWPDLFIGRHANPGWLVYNDHHGFEAPPDVSIPRRDRHGCSAGDANGDGLPDLYCANGAYHGAGFKSNELYVQQPDGTFQDQALALRATDPFGRGRLAVMFDLDHDRYADLFLADRPARTDGLPSIDRVLANPGGNGYVARSLAGFDASGGADCLRAADLDQDGWTDIVLCERGMDRVGAFGIHILRNMHGRLVDVTAGSGIQKRQAVDAIVADMDGDGRPDIVEVTPYQLRIHLRRGNGYVLGYTRTLDHGVAVAAGDVNGDGKRDLYVVQGTHGKQRPDLMLLNQGSGRSFRTMALPRVTSGSAESVTPIDYDQNGLTDFLVLNGKGSQHPGPVQLIAFFPRR